MKITGALGVVAIASVIVGCSRDPETIATRHVERGDEYAAASKYGEAAIEYANAAQAHPSSVGAHLGLAETALREGDGDSALRELRQVAELRPDDVTAQVRAGALLLLSGQVDEARTRAETALKLNAADPQAHQLLGATLTQSHDLDASEQSLQSAVRLAPQSIDARLALAAHEWRRGRPAAAEAEYGRALALDPRHVLANRAIAGFYMGNGRAHDAERHWRTVAEAAQGEPFALVDFWLSQSRFDEAVRHLQGMRSDEALRARATVRLAAGEYARGQKLQAHAVLNQFLKSTPGDTAALVLQARFLGSEGRIDEALRVAEQAGDSAPQSAEPVLVQAMLHLARGDSTKALERFETAFSTGSRSSAALAVAGIKLQHGHKSEASEWAERAWQAQPYDLPTRLQVVSLLVASGELTRAEALARTNSRDYPSEARVQVQLGDVLRVARRNDEARAAFSTALTIAPDDVNALAALTALDLDERRAEAARTRVKVHLARHPQSSELLLLAGRMEAALGDTRAAEQLLRRAIDMNSGSGPAYQALAQLYLHAKRYDQALAVLRQVAQAQPNDAETAMAMAMIMDQQGQATEARTQYQRVLALNPRHGTAANNLAWLLFEEDRHEALRLARVAYEELGEAPEAMDTLGWALIQTEAFAEAIRLLTRAVRAKPTHATYHYHLGLAFLGAGDAESARGEFKAALRWNPSPTERQAVQAALRRADAHSVKAPS